MRRDITHTYDNLVKLFEEREPEIDAHKKATEIMKTYEAKLRYYVTTIGEPKLSDIIIGAVVKTPAKYFNTLNHAKIFQLKTIFEQIESGKDIGYIKNYSKSDIQSMKDELKDLSDKHPEYIL